MQKNTITRAELLELLAQAIAQGASSTVITRLQCMVYYKECGSVTKTCRQYGITRMTFYRWQDRLQPADASCLEDRRERRQLADDSRCSLPSVTYNIPKVVCTCIVCKAQRVCKIVGRRMTHMVTALLGFLLLALYVVFTQLESAKASSWDSTLLVNTESFIEIDEADLTSDVYIQFGSSLTDQLSFSGALNQFTFTDTLYIQGDIVASGGLVINNDTQGDSTLTFGNDVASQTVTLLQGQNVLNFSTGATFAGALSGSSLTVGNLQNCDTIDTDATGNLVCGTDEKISATDMFVDELGDTMEGGLIVDIDTFTGSYLQPNDASVSANLTLWLDASQLTGLSDGDAVITWADESGNSNDITQGSATYRPTYETAEIGGMPVVRFDGTDDYLHDTSASYTARTVFIIQRISSSLQQTGELAQLWGNYGDGVQVAPDPRQSEGYWSFDGNAAAQARCGTNGDSYNSTFENGLACDWNYDTAQMHVVEFQGDEPLTATTVGSLFPAFSVGAHQYGGDIAEIIVYDRVLTDQEREGIENALSDKYALLIGTQNQAINNSGSIALSVVSESVAGPAIEIDIQGDSNSPHLRFGSGGVVDTNLYRAAADTLATDDSFVIGATLSGATVAGFGLVDCNGENEALHWDDVTKKFTCYTKQGDENLFIARSTDGANFNANPRLITWEAEDAKDTDHFAHVANAADITLVSTGWYKVEYLLTWDQAAQNNRIGMRCYLTDGGTLIPGTESYGYSRDDTQVSRGSCTMSFIFENTVASNNIRLQADIGQNDDVYDDTNANVVERESVNIVLEYLGS